jgi:hypothetical protein
MEFRFRPRAAARGEALRAGGNVCGPGAAARFTALLRGESLADTTPRNGHTKAALRRAEQLIDIRLLTEDEALETDHAAVDPCPHCAIKKRKPRGLVFWDGQFPLPSGPMIAMVFTGKCDVCRGFAFWCWDCGEKVVVPDGERYVCACEQRWFTEADNDEMLFVVATDDGEVPLDRRPVR